MPIFSKVSGLSEEILQRYSMLGQMLVALWVTDLGKAKEMLSIHPDFTPQNLLEWADEYRKDMNSEQFFGLVNKAILNSQPIANTHPGWACGILGKPLTQDSLYAQDVLSSMSFDNCYDVDDIKIKMKNKDCSSEAIDYIISINESQILLALLGKSLAATRKDKEFSNVLDLVTEAKSSHEAYKIASENLIELLGSGKSNDLLALYLSASNKYRTEIMSAIIDCEYLNISPKVLDVVKQLSKSSDIDLAYTAQLLLSSCDPEE